MAGRPVGWSLPGRAELPAAIRRALRRQRSRAGALPRGHFDQADAPVRLLGCASCLRTSARLAARETSYAVGDSRSGTQFRWRVAAARGGAAALTTMLKDQADWIHLVIDWEFDERGY